MGRSSTRENKTRYQLAREELGLSREKASELLETIAPERIEKIESERSLPRPDEVLIMAEKYKTPSLCNYFCARQCPIGQQYVPEIRNSVTACVTLAKRPLGVPPTFWVGEFAVTSCGNSASNAFSSRVKASYSKSSSSGAS